ncbi:MAG: hypothetical protein GOVbin655_46 [Prokaryotic dsDNA virus sp.]|nr:hypothetical protein [Acinetobacter sp.]QDP47212.1 MAG: hypothetical protein GOVbin655_46 [Prokaryotic dsDNA virus sp.]|tara:strand:- start:3375 stop:3560 length:186 start_codon:yes stop_codon:yes gene_type:complete
MGKIANALISWYEENDHEPTIGDLIEIQKQDRKIIENIIKEKVWKQNTQQSLTAGSTKTKK